METHRLISITYTKEGIELTWESIESGERFVNTMELTEQQKEQLARLDTPLTIEVNKPI